MSSISGVRAADPLFTYANASQNRTEPAATDPPVNVTDPSNANSAPNPETPQEKAWYQKALDWTGDRFNEMGQAIQYPGEGLKGAAKEIGNMPAGLWNAMMLGGTAQAGSDLQQGAMFRSGPDGDKMMQLGQDMIQNPAKYAAPGMAEEPFKMSNPAQQGGANILNVLSTAVPIGGGAKTLFTAAKDIGELGGGANLAANTAKDVGELGGGANLADVQFGGKEQSLIKGVPEQGSADVQQQVSKYLSVGYDEPWVSPGGYVHESSSIRIPAGKNIVNSRRTPDGGRADAAVRRGVYQQTGMHPGHDHPTQLGVDPSDTRNIRPQNAVQNGPGGTWYKNETNIQALIKANPDLDYSQMVTRVTPPGEVAPFYRKIVSTSDGKTFGDNVLYGNFPSPASRAAASNGRLEPGQAGLLDNQFKRDVKAQMKPTPETEAAGNQFARVLAMRQSLSSMTSEQKAAYIAERNKLVVPNQPEPPTDVLPDGRDSL